MRNLPCVLSPPPTRPLARAPTPPPPPGARTLSESTLRYALVQVLQFVHGIVACSALTPPPPPSPTPHPPTDPLRHIMLLVHNLLRVLSPVPAPPQPLSHPPPPDRDPVRITLGYALVQVLQFVHGIVAPLADVPVAELALQLYLQAAYSASEVARLEMIAYEFMEQVLFLHSNYPPSPPPRRSHPSTSPNPFSPACSLGPHKLALNQKEAWAEYEYHLAVHFFFAGFCVHGGLHTRGEWNTHSDV